MLDKLLFLNQQNNINTFMTTFILNLNKNKVTYLVATRYFSLEVHTKQINVRQIIFAK